jgi:phage-related minor tail protein
MTDVERAMSRLRNKEPLADIDYETIIAVIDHFESMWDEAQGILAQKQELEHKLERAKCPFRQKNETT